MAFTLTTPETVQRLGGELVQFSADVRRRIAVATYEVGDSESVRRFRIEWGGDAPNAIPFTDLLNRCPSTRVLADELEQAAIDLGKVIATK